MLKNLFNNKSKEDWSDAELIQKYKTSENNHYVGILYTRYTHMVFGVCMKYLKNEHDCEDAVVQIFEKLLKDLKVFEIENFRGWLHQVARNFCLMWLRKRQTQQKRTEQYTNIAQSDVEYQDASHLLHENEEEKQLSDLQIAISELKSEQKECVELFFLQEKSYQEITDMTGYSLKQVKSYIQNGKRNLKLKLSSILLLLCQFLGW